MVDERSEIDSIHDLLPGDIISFPIENQSVGRRLIVDDRTPRRDGTVALLGENGGVYHLEQVEDLVHLNIYTRKTPVGSEWGPATSTT